MHCTDILRQSQEMRFSVLDRQSSLDAKLKKGSMKVRPQLPNKVQQVLKELEIPEHIFKITASTICNSDHFPSPGKSNLNNPRESRHATRLQGRAELNYAIIFLISTVRTTTDETRTLDEGMSTIQCIVEYLVLTDIIAHGGQKLRMFSHRTYISLRSSELLHVAKHCPH